MYKSVMVIDDMQFDRFVANHVITKFGFAEQVIQMESASDALRYLVSKEQSPDELPEVIFLDIQMPDINGYQFLDQFEKLPGSITDHCKIIMLTSSIDIKDIKRANEYKLVKGYIVKPLDKEKLDKLPVFN
jgi:CheY-like chemotaxis protein